VYTVIDPNSTIADIPSNYLTMTYSLGGGDSILVAIKKLAEAQHS